MCVCVCVCVCVCIRVCMSVKSYVNPTPPSPPLTHTDYIVT